MTRRNSADPDAQDTNVECIMGWKEELDEDESAVRLINGRK